MWTSQGELCLSVSAVAAHVILVALRLDLKGFAKKQNRNNKRPSPLFPPHPHLTFSRESDIIEWYYRVGPELP